MGFSMVGDSVGFQQKFAITSECGTVNDHGLQREKRMCQIQRIRPIYGKGY